MPRYLDQPVRIPSAGHPPKTIQEFVGRVATRTERFSVAWMRSPAGWSEPGQAPEFDECTIVLSGSLHVEHAGGTIVVSAGQGVVVEGGEWVRYSTSEETEYLAFCCPAFSPANVHRDDR